MSNAILSNELTKLHADFERVYSSFIAGGVDVREDTKKEGYAVLGKMHDALCSREEFDRKNTVS